MSLSDEDKAEIRNLVVDGTMEAINAVVIPRFDEIEVRLDRHDKQFDQINAHLKEHDQQFGEIRRQLTSIESRLTGLEGQVKALDNDVKDIYGLVPSEGSKLTPEKRLRQLYASMQLLARELNVEL